MLQQTQTLTKPNSIPTLEKWFRQLLFRKLQNLNVGQLIIHDPAGSRTFQGSTEGPSAVIQVTDTTFYTAISLRGSLGAAESYMAGHWHADSLVSVVRILVLNQDLLQGFEGGLASLQKIAGTVYHFAKQNSIKGSKRNIAAHYDLSNEMFELFLDKTMMYSSAFYEKVDSTLDEAQFAKLDLICRKLNLGSKDHVIEIGTGWGGFAIHAAKRYGCRVTTTTISKEQYTFAKGRIHAEGLEGQIELLEKDYRQLEGNYSKLVSIEMIEAVGHQYLDEYMAKCASLLEENGCGLIQAITINDQIYDRALKEVDFIKKYIFPGSFIPSISAILESTKKKSDLRLYNLEDLTPHYARTLSDWRQRFLGNSDKLRAMGFDDRFIKMWDYYFCYCIGGFEERSIGNIHLMFGKPGYRGDLTRHIQWNKGKQP
jgi:cyclopropane-fatty-acyl-phospholipid synthase